MRAVYYTSFATEPKIVELADPITPHDGVVLEVEASGICRSDWHGWMGHDPDIQLPHVPGHEMAGRIVDLGPGVSKWKLGQRITLPFICACGSCVQCSQGHGQVCRNQYQPGFTHWGSFAQYVAVHRADFNLISLPDLIDSVTAASLGCRFATSYSAVVNQAKIKVGDWIAVHGCGGVGLSAIMIASALGARVIGIDIADEALKIARLAGAECIVNETGELVVENILEITSGGAHASIDALGSPDTMLNSIHCLRPKGRHIQIGLMPGSSAHTPLPLPKIIGQELEILGSHGMAASQYGEMIKLISDGRVSPELLIGGTCSLLDAIDILVNMDTSPPIGINIINSF